VVIPLLNPVILNSKITCPIFYMEINRKQKDLLRVLGLLWFFIRYEQQKQQQCLKL
jgi:hypothetical protein